MAGGGVLSIPYSFKASGLGLGIGLLFFMSCIGIYSCMLIVQCGKMYYIYRYI